MKEKNILDILYDPDNYEDIPFENDNGEVVLFEQLAILPYGDDTYAVLKPKDPKKLDIDENAVLFYYINEDEENMGLEMVEDDDLNEKLFQELMKLID